jgi:2-iminobutanoate/2-iminopropanoate deaminase
MVSILFESNGWPRPRLARVQVFYHDHIALQHHDSVIKDGRSVAADRDFNAPHAHPPVAAYTRSQAPPARCISAGRSARGWTAQFPTTSSQGRLAWQNLEAQLKAGGVTLDNLVKITTILPNHGDLAAAREGRSKVPGDRKSASTLIIGGLANPAWKIEIEGIAVT